MKGAGRMTSSHAQLQSATKRHHEGGKEGGQPSIHPHPQARTPTRKDDTALLIHSPTHPHPYPTHPPSQSTAHPPHVASRPPGQASPCLLLLFLLLPSRPRVRPNPTPFYATKRPPSRCSRLLHPRRARLPFERPEHGRFHHGRHHYHLAKESRRLGERR